MIEHEYKPNSYIREFKSIKDFKDYIDNTPFNEAFRWAYHSSVSADKKFTATESYKEALDLLEHGWDDGAKKINKKLKLNTQMMNKLVNKTVYDVTGFQCSVPRYLQGVPTSMINKRPMPVKQKIVTITKDVCYNGGWGADRMIEESVPVINLVQQLEAQGIRVNLNIVLGTKAGAWKSEHMEACKICVKSANERLALSKVAFLIAHPSMLRRFLFRYIEVAPTVTKEYTHGYGRPFSEDEMKVACGKDEIYIPRVLTSSDAQEILNKYAK